MSKKRRYLYVVRGREIHTRVKARNSNNIEQVNELRCNRMSDKGRIIRRICVAKIFL